MLEPLIAIGRTSEGPRGLHLHIWADKGVFALSWLVPDVLTDACALRLARGIVARSTSIPTWTRTDPYFRLSHSPPLVPVFGGGVHYRP